MGQDFRRQRRRIIANRNAVGDTSDSLHVGWWAGTASANGKVYFSLDGPGCEWGAISTTNVADGTWHHVAGVRSGLTTYKVYVDGVLQGNTNQTVGSGCNANSANGPSSWFVGRSNAWTVNFNGSIDEVAVFNKALSDADIANIYQQQSGQYSIGVSGVTGKSGAAGASGVTGKTGATGASGASGASGTSGASGATGFTGPTCIYGGSCTGATTLTNGAMVFASTGNLNSAVTVGASYNLAVSGPATFAGTGVTLSPGSGGNLSITTTSPGAISLDSTATAGSGITIGAAAPSSAGIIALGTSSGSTIKVQANLDTYVDSSRSPYVTSTTASCTSTEDIMMGALCSCNGAGASTQMTYPNSSTRWTCGCSTSDVTSTVICERQTTGDWWNLDWSKRIKITLDNSAGATALTNIPVMVI